MYFSSIQFLRAIAAVYVVLFHIYYWWNKTPGELSGIFDRGYAGLDLFFVISGFVVYQSSLKFRYGFGGATAFLKRRLIRIYPIYWLLLLSFLLTGLCHFNQLSAGGIVKTFLLLPGHETVITTSWTLQYELYFYMLTGLLVLHEKFKWLLAIVLLAAVAAFCQEIFFTGKSYLPETGINNGFVLEFFSGILAYKYYQKIGAAIALVLVIAGSIFFFYPFNGNIPRCLVPGIPALCIVVGLVSLEFHKKVRIPSILRLTGDASYCLYLVHVPVLYAILPAPPAGTIQRAYIILLILATIITSIMVHLLIEKPILHYLNRKFTEPAAKKESAAGIDSV